MLVWCTDRVFLPHHPAAVDVDEQADHPQVHVGHTHQGDHAAPLVAVARETHDGAVGVRVPVLRAPSLPVALALALLRVRNEATP